MAQGTSKERVHFFLVHCFFIFGQQPQRGHVLKNAADICPYICTSVRLCPYVRMSVPLYIHTSVCLSVPPGPGSLAQAIWPITSGPGSLAKAFWPRVYKGLMEKQISHAFYPLDL